MMFCKQCGAQIPDGSSFCVSCGSPVAQNSNEPKQAPDSYQQPYTQANEQQNPYVQPQTFDTNTQPEYQQPYAQTNEQQNPYAQPQNFGANGQSEYQQPYAQTNEQQNPYAQPQNFDANGQPIQQYSTAQAAAVKVPMSPEKKKKIIIFGSIGGGVLVIAIALIIIFSLIGKGANSSCSAAIDTYFNSALSGNVEEYVKVIPPEIVSYMVRERYDGDYNEFIDDMEDSISLSSLFSSSIQFKYDIIQEQHCTDSKSLMDMTKKYRDRYDAAAQIVDAAKCRVRTYTTYGNIGTPSTDTDTLYLVNIGGNWYIDDYSLCSSVSSSKFH